MKKTEFKSKIPYYVVEKGEESECYCLHRPSKCNQKFPPTNRPIHVCEVPKKETIMVPQGSAFRKMIIPSHDKNLYPCIMDTKEYQRILDKSKVISSEERKAIAKERERKIAQEAHEAEKRKELLKKSQRRQPGVKKDIDADASSGGVDEAAANATRAEIIINDRLPCPAAANRVILETKCRMIRDAQLDEKAMLMKAYREEELRLDAIMEENRQLAIAREEKASNHRKELLLNNRDAIRSQIEARDAARAMEIERIEEESIRTNMANIAMQIDQVNKLKKKHEDQNKLKKMLDTCNAELMYYKQVQLEEERIFEERIKKFLRDRQARDDANRAQAAAIKEAKQKGLAHLGDAQKAEKALKEELERIRHLKMQEEVEANYRKKEMELALKKKRDLNHLHEAREEQIRDIHRTIARDIAREEQLFHDAAKQNEEYLIKERKKEQEYKESLENYRQEIMQQIREKEKRKAELREISFKEGEKIREKIENEEKLERAIVKEKLADMRRQGIPEKYIKETEDNIRKLKCL